MESASNIPATATPYQKTPPTRTTTMESGSTIPAATPSTTTTSTT